MAPGVLFFAQQFVEWRLFPVPESRLPGGRYFPMVHDAIQPAVKHQFIAWQRKLDVRFFGRLTMLEHRYIIRKIASWFCMCFAQKVI